MFGEFVKDVALIGSSVPESEKLLMGSELPSQKNF
jgi:hypothetical protein